MLLLVLDKIGTKQNPNTQLNFKNFIVKQEKTKPQITARLEKQDCKLLLKALPNSNLNRKKAWLGWRLDRTRQEDLAQDKGRQTEIQEVKGHSWKE